MIACAVALLLAAAPSAPAPPAVDPSVAPIVDRMQKFYERTKSFDARFEQSFQQAGVPSRFAGSAAQGRIRFRKPVGKGAPAMRWDYDKGGISLLVGDHAYVYDADSKQATEYTVGQEQLSAAVTFLWGTGKLADEFVITRSGRTDLGDGAVLELTPRKPASTYAKVFFVVDPETGIVKRSVVVQTGGSENRVTFLTPKLDTSIPEADLDPKKAFPAGTTMTKAVLPKN